MIILALKQQQQKKHKKTKQNKTKQKNATTTTFIHYAFIIYDDYFSYLFIANYETKNTNKNDNT